MAAKRSSKASAKKPPKRSPVKAARERKLPLKQKLANFRGEVSGQIAEVSVLSDDDCVAHVRSWMSTGCLELDRALTPPSFHQEGKLGGFPCGRVIEIYGPAHIGKSTLLDHTFASVQRLGGAAILLETDSGRDEHYTGRIGVDTSQLQYFQFAEDAGSIEHVTDEAIAVIRWWRHNSPETPVVVGFDALGVTPTQEEIEKTVTKGSTASAAKVLRKACRKFAGIIAGSQCALVILNHEYKAISFGGGVTPSKTYGGDALPLLSAVRLKLHPVKDAWLKESDGTILGRRVGYEVVKFKLGPAYRTGEFAILSGRGVDNVWTIWNTLARAEIIAVSGAWGAININGEVLKFQGWSGLRRLCAEKPELFGQLVDIYRRYVGTQDAAL